MNNHLREPNSTSLQQTDALPRCERVVALGRKLVDELGAEPAVDTLSRWMAHYVAELIDAASNAAPEERAAAESKCFDTIMELWGHRAELPDGRRPLENLEPIVRALESLDPDNEMPRFFRSVRGTIDRAEESSHTLSLLDFVDGIDSTARILIGYTLADAARSALDESKEWVAAAEEAGTGPGFVRILTSFVTGGRDGDVESDRIEFERKRLLDQLECLEAFTRVAAGLTDELRGRLDALSSGDLDGSGDDGKAG